MHFFFPECGCSGTDEECPIGGCECDGQLRVNSDCTTVRKCNQTLDAGYEDITCDSEDDIVYVNLRTLATSCGVVSLL